MAELVYNIAFNQPFSNTLGSQLKKVIDFLVFLKSHPEANPIVINLSKIKFVHPLFILSIASLTDHLKNKGFDISMRNTSFFDCASYLKNIHFPNGIKPDELPDWENVLDNYKGKSYLPIINFSTSREVHHSTIRERLLSKISSLIKTNLKLDGNYEAAVSYLISEITDNTIEHSGKDRGWLMVQYYPSSGYLDICIIDTGKTILGAYREHGVLGAENDSQALDLALSGISTKSPERGTGIRTSKAIALLGLQGDFTLFSGSALYFGNKILTLPVYWSGTFVAMRIKKGVENFSIYSYV